MDAPTFAHKVGISPVRWTYTYLAHPENLVWSPGDGTRMANCIFKSQIGAWNVWHGYVAENDLRSMT
jgi:hypothetical protein